MSITIALVDDQLLIRKALKELLESFGEIRVQAETDNGLILIDRLSIKSSVPDICIISSPAFLLADIWTVREIKKRFEKMKILVLASHFHELTISRLLHEKVNGFLLKNSRPDEFKKAVFAVHANGKYWPKFTQEVIEAIGKIAPSNRTIKKHHVEFMKLCCEDITYQEIGEKMTTPVRTIESYRDYLFEKFKVYSRSSLVLFAIKNGFIELK